MDFTFPWRSRSYESINASCPVVLDNKVFVSASYEIQWAGTVVTGRQTRSAVRSSGGGPVQPYTFSFLTRPCLDPQKAPQVAGERVRTVGRVSKSFPECVQALDLAVQRHG